MTMRGEAGRDVQMKYGGQGGWKAVKRFNRDADVAAGRSPYGGGRRSPKPEPLGPIGGMFLILIVLISIPIALV